MHHVWSGGVRSAAQWDGAGHLSRAGRRSLAPEHEHGAIPVVVPSPAHITEPVLRHTSLGECPSNWLDATVCRYRLVARDAGRRADGDGSDLHCDFVGFEAQ
jgi:hypothetical protein